MSETDKSQKTEQPTSKKLSEAKKKGDVLQSRELATALVVVAGAASRFAYSIVSTPTVISIEPAFASALGGDVVTITGAGFVASNVGAHEVTLNDYPVTVSTRPPARLPCEADSECTRSAISTESAAGLAA